MHWDTSSVMFPKILWCFGSHTSDTLPQATQSGLIGPCVDLCPSDICPRLRPLDPNPPRSSIFCFCGGLDGSPFLSPFDAERGIYLAQGSGSKASAAHLDMLTANFPSLLVALLNEPLVHKPLALIGFLYKGVSTPVVLRSPLPSCPCNNAY